MEVEISEKSNITDQNDQIYNAIKAAKKSTGNRKAMLTITIDILD